MRLTLPIPVHPTQQAWLMAQRPRQQAWLTAQRPQAEFLLLVTQRSSLNTLRRSTRGRPFVAPPPVVVRHHLLRSATCHSLAASHSHLQMPIAPLTWPPLGLALSLVV